MVTAGNSDKCYNVPPVFDGDRITSAALPFSAHHEQRQQRHARREQRCQCVFTQFPSLFLVFTL